jgi:hypothetical protein
MAIRWLYETTTGTNYCTVMTSDDTNTQLPDFDELPDSFQYAWSANDPTLEPPAIRDLVPRKRYNIAENKIYECNAAQNAAWNLRVAKFRKNLAIDRRTGVLFDKGMSYDGEGFPLDIDDSVNYYILYKERNNSSVITWPHTITTRGRDTYSIADANSMKLFGEAAIARQRELVDGARDLKKSIHDATTVSAVDAIVDSRV